MNKRTRIRKLVCRALWGVGYTSAYAIGAVSATALYGLYLASQSQCMQEARAAYESGEGTV